MRMRRGAVKSQRPRLPLARRLLKLVHPEAIPGPATPIYNAVSSSRIFQWHYDLVARDIARYCAQGTLLDVGTGPGWLLLKLHEAAPGMRLVGLDASPAMVAQAQRNAEQAGLATKIEVTAGHAGHLPFPDGTVDLVVSTGSIHHWKEPVAALNEVHRVLKSGGQALVYDLATDTPAEALGEMRRQFGWLWTTLFRLHGLQEPFYSSGAFEALARESAFGEGRTRFVGSLCCLLLRKPAPQQATPAD